MSVSVFDEIRFPEGISYGAIGGPKFKTTILPLASGFEKRNVDWANSRGEWDVSYGLKTQAELDAIRTFFMARRGRATGFRFKDWTDYKMVRQAIGVTDATTSVFQVYKRYTSGSSTYDRKIRKPVNGTLSIWVNGIPASSPTIDYTTGVITLSYFNYSTTGQSIEVACEFDAAVRFDTDHMAPNITDYNVFQWGSIPIVELRT